MALNDVKTPYVYDGKMIDYTPGSAMTAGDIAILGTAAAAMIGIAKADIAASVLGALAIEGVFEFVCAEALTLGAKVYLTSAGVVTATVGTNTPLGRCVSASYLTDTRVKVKINVP